MLPYLTGRLPRGLLRRGPSRGWRKKIVWQNDTACFAVFGGPGHEVTSREAVTPPSLGWRGRVAKRFSKEIALDLPFNGQKSQPQCHSCATISMSLYCVQARG